MSSSSPLLARSSSAELDQRSAGEELTMADFGAYMRYHHRTLGCVTP